MLLPFFVDQNIFFSKLKKPTQTYVQPCYSEQKKSLGACLYLAPVRSYGRLKKDPFKIVFVGLLLILLYYCCLSHCAIHRSCACHKWIN